ncbi:MAG: hypothetical protein B6242_09800 [Anaerolineaceae bacterium 4572_78]|nr:MAG: hypothetical protein B6242_09800 [Anaerolineaceae bacterium 4572_78]
MSKDHNPGSMDNPQTQNGWSYARHNPINRVDPSGRIDWQRCHVDPNDDFGECTLEQDDSYYGISRQVAPAIGVPNPSEEYIVSHYPYPLSCHNWLHGGNFNSCSSANFLSDFEPSTVSLKIMTRPVSCSVTMLFFTV